MKESIKDILGLICLAFIYDTIGVQFAGLIAIIIFIFSLARSGISSYWIPVIVSLLASTKFPESDFYVYMKQFESAISLDFMDFISNNFKSPIFYTLMWIIGVLVKSWAAASFLIIFIPNYIMYRVLQRLASDEFQLLLFSLLLFGFYPIYDQSNHLMRQYLASSILFALVYAQRNNVGLLISGFLSHLSFIVFITAHFKRKNVKYLLLLTPLIFFPAAYNWLELFVFNRNINVIDYKPLNSMQILLISPILITPFLNRKTFIYVLLVILTMLLFNNNSEIILRYWKYLVFFVPTIFIEIALRNRAIGHLLIYIFIPIEYFYFINNFLNTTWTYMI